MLSKLSEACLQNHYKENALTEPLKTQLGQHSSSGKKKFITTSLVSYSNVKWVHVLIEIKPAIFDDRTSHSCYSAS